MIDMLVYGLIIATLCLSSFVLVLYPWGGGQIGFRCNESIGDGCDTIFRARATCFATITWFSVFLAWEVIDMRRSFFRMQPGSPFIFTQWVRDVWRNKFLFWSVMAGFITIFPVLYIPVINDVVFKHTGISWEWGIVFVASLLFFAGVESWKWAKRIYFRRQAKKNGVVSNDDVESRIFKRYLTESSIGDEKTLA
jgi:magnesium-transporting ATPase (P-type)